MKPIEWRLSETLTLDEAARLAGVSGVNPGRTYQRYESGRRAAPANVVQAIFRLSGGSVGPSDWHDARLQFLNLAAEDQEAA